MRGALPSIAVHAAVVLVAVHATANAAISHERQEPPTVHYVPNVPPGPIEHHRVPNGGGGANASSVDAIPLHAKPIVWPTTVPVYISFPDSSAGSVAIGRSEFGPGVNTGPSVGFGNSVHGSGPYSAGDVERPVSPVGAAPTPTYPEALRSSNVRGAVTAEFVVDTTGRVEPGSFRAVASDNDLFTAAVREAVLRTRFHPAEAGGRRVRQLVQESFSFVLQ